MSVLTELSGRITEQMVRRRKRRLEDAGYPFELIARDVLAELEFSGEGAATGERPPAAALLLQAYLWGQLATIARHTGRHLVLVIVSLVAGILVALPLGLALKRRRAIAEPVIRIVGLLQSIPSIALLVFMIPLLGVGVQPALVALFLYSLFPIVRNSYIGCGMPTLRRWGRRRRWA